MDPVAAFAEQAKACAALGSPMYAALLTSLVADLEAGGPTRRVLEGHEDDPGSSALALRLLGSVHRLVLERRAGELAAFYPSVGGTWDPEDGSAAFLSLLAEQPDLAREWLDRPPQTNEVGRSTALVGGLLHVPVAQRRPVRLFEIGSSGGLNLLADEFAFVDDAGQRFGSRRSRPVLEPAWSAKPLPRWPGLRFEERVGCDQRPIDVSTTEGRLALTAYVWPDQAARLERLRAAMAIARDRPVTVRRQGADDFVKQVSVADGSLTVLWHSVMWQYLTPGEKESISTRIDELGSAADDDSPFAHVYLEPVRPGPGERREFVVALTTWPGGVRRVLGEAAPHGLPVTWTP